MDTLLQLVDEGLIQMIAAASSVVATISGIRNCHVRDRGECCAVCIGVNDILG